MQWILIGLALCLIVTSSPLVVHKCLSTLRSLYIPCQSSDFAVRILHAHVGLSVQGSITCQNTVDEECITSSQVVYGTCQGSVEYCQILGHRIGGSLMNCPRGKTPNYVDVKYECIKVTDVEDICSSDLKEGESGYLGNTEFPLATPDSLVQCTCQACPLQKENTLLYITILGITESDVDCSKGSFGKVENRICLVPSGEKQDVNLLPIKVNEDTQFTFLQQIFSESLGQIFIYWKAEAPIKLHCYNSRFGAHSPPACPKLTTTTTEPTTPIQTTNATSSSTSQFITNGPAYHTEQTSTITQSYSLTTEAAGNKLESGVAAGIAIAVILVVTVPVIILIVLYYKYKKNQSKGQSADEPPAQFMDIINPKATVSRRNSATYNIYTVPVSIRDNINHTRKASDANNISEDEDSLVENIQAPSITSPGVKELADIHGIYVNVSDNKNNNHKTNNTEDVLAALPHVDTWASKPIALDQSASGFSYPTDDVEVKSIETMSYSRSRQCSIATNCELKSVSSCSDLDKSVHNSKADFYFGSQGSLNNGVNHVHREDSFSDIASRPTSPIKRSESQDTIADAKSIESFTDDNNIGENLTQKYTGSLMVLNGSERGDSPLFKRTVSTDSETDKSECSTGTVINVAERRESNCYSIDETETEESEKVEHL